jgi:hypothetical protein
MRPSGLARGVSAYLATWVGGALIAMLTGATAVVILLAIGFVAAVAATVSGPLALRRAAVHEVRTATVATAGDELAWHVRATVPRPVFAVVSVDGEAVARGWLAPGETQLPGVAPRRGVHQDASVAMSTSGLMGMLWWRRRIRLQISTLWSGPAPAADPAPAVRAPDDPDGAAAPSTHSGHDDVDGVRQWRDGDEVTAVHWPSTMRLGEFVVRQRQRDHEEQWVVTARSGTADPDAEAARVRRALDDCMSRGALAAVQVDDGPVQELPTAAAVVQWSAAFEPVSVARTRVPFHRRELFAGGGPEPDADLEPVARWVVGGASVLPLAMLLQPLGYGPVELVTAAAGAAAAAFVTTRRPEVRPWLRQLAGLVAGLFMAIVLIDISAVSSVMTAMRYLMPQALVALCIVQGFECTERRGARVALSCAALLTMYAAGVRVDGALGPMMFGAVLLIGLASAAITRPDRRPRRSQGLEEVEHPRASLRSTLPFAGIALAAAAVVGLLAVVPIPQGPAQLTLPSWLSEQRPAGVPGELASPSGSPLLGGPLQGGGSRSGAGAGGYPGFSNTMDTSLRGDLGDQVVMRVRAPAPDFWRGQTFTRFDGRTWYVEQYPDGQGNDGPDHTIPPGDGDLYDSTVEADFTQTFYVEADMPNILFAAPQALRVIIDGTVWYRPDGALRSDFVLPKGSAYTVQSHRSNTTAEALRLVRYDGFRIPTKFLEVPKSTSDRTRALAKQLAAGSPSTYDTVLRIEQWLRANTEYDLNAPIPPARADAVDDFLFESQRGFCEQIASATTIMLRTLGVPARLATGYVPSERDEIAGVWISRASDAHAWVEVWFPDYGWVSFDPTAAVPLAGESSTGSIGGALLKAFGAVLGDHIPLIVGSLVGIGVLSVAVRALAAFWRRRRRGRWGVLQDRFLAAAVARGASPNAPNADLAGSFSGSLDDRSAAEIAAEVATVLDECAFSPAWHDDDTRYERAAGTVDVLERTPRST